MVALNQAFTNNVGLPYFFENAQEQEWVLPKGDQPEVILMNKNLDPLHKHKRHNIFLTLLVSLNESIKERPDFK